MAKIILITGASTGFGRDTTETLTRAGHRVFASMRDIAGRTRRTRTMWRRPSLVLSTLKRACDRPAPWWVNDATTPMQQGVVAALGPGSLATLAA